VLTPCVYVIRFLQKKVIIFSNHHYGLVLAAKNEFARCEIGLIYCECFNLRLQRSKLFHSLLSHCVGLHSTVPSSQEMIHDRVINCPKNHSFLRVLSVILINCDHKTTLLNVSTPKQISVSTLATNSALLWSRRYQHVHKQTTSTFVPFSTFPCASQ
jgi:hypothetical protein